MPFAARYLAFACPLLLAGCNGVGVFFADTHSFTSRVNAPLANSENARRVSAKAVEIEPMSAESGNVWPGPVTPEPTLEDLQKAPVKPLPNLEGATPPTLSNVPALVIPVIPHHLQPRGDDSGILNGPLPSSLGTGGGTGGAPKSKAGQPLDSPQGTVTQTPQGPAISTRNPSGLGASKPNPDLGITVPNGDGTSTVIAPDGTISTIKTPK